jgi:hypothetical protein
MKDSELSAEVVVPSGFVSQLEVDVGWYCDWLLGLPRLCLRFAFTDF